LRATTLRRSVPSCLEFSFAPLGLSIFPLAAAAAVGLHWFAAARLEFTGKGKTTGKKD